MPVRRNYTTVANVALTPVVVADLVIEGKVIDESNAQAVGNATVALQTKDKDGNWVTVDAVLTGADGKYTFDNTDPDDQYIDLAGEYQVVIEKEITADELDSVYAEKTYAVKFNKKGPKTTAVNEVTAVEEVKSFKVDVAWTEDALEAYADSNITVDFLHVNNAGVVTTLESTDLVKDTDFEVATSGKFKEATDFLKDGAVKFQNAAATSGADATPRLVSGTYFVRVQDAENAISIVPVEVTEGGDVAISVELDVANNYSLTTKVEDVRYGASLANTTTLNTLDTLVAADFATVKAQLPATDTALATITGTDAALTDGDNVEVEMVVYETVAGVDIPLYATSQTKSVNLKYDSGTVTGYSGIQLLTEAFEFEKLGKKEYKAIANSPYVSNLQADNTFTPGGDISAKTLSVASATSVTGVTFTDGVAPVVPTTVTNIKLIDEAGKVVAETGAYKPLAGASSIFVESEDALGQEVLVTDAFTSVKPGKYKFEVEVPGFEKYTSEEFITIVDFSHLTYELELEAIEEPVVSGYVMFEDYTSVDDGDGATTTEYSVAVYDKETGALVGSLDGEADTYTIDNSNASLVIGRTYTVVVRGEGVETAAKDITVKAGQNAPLNFLVKKGADGLFKYTIVGTDNNPLTGGSVKAHAIDQYEARNYTAQASIQTAIDAYDAYVVANTANPTSEATKRALTKLKTAIANAESLANYNTADDLATALKEVNKTSFTAATIESALDSAFAANTALTGVEFTGTSVAAQSATTFSFADISQSVAYSVVVEDLDDSKYAPLYSFNAKDSYFHTSTISLPAVNATFSGLIKVPLKGSVDGELTTTLTVDLAGGLETDGFVDYIEVVNKTTGELVDYVAGTTLDATVFTVPTDNVYTVNVYLSNGQKATAEAVVQSFDEEVVVTAVEVER